MSKSRLFRDCCELHFSALQFGINILLGVGVCRLDTVHQFDGSSDGENPL